MGQVDGVEVLPKYIEAFAWAKLSGRVVHGWVAAVVSSVLSHGVEGVVVVGLEPVAEWPSIHGILWDLREISGDELSQGWRVMTVLQPIAFESDGSDGEVAVCIPRDGEKEEVVVIDVEIGGDEVFPGEEGFRRVLRELLVQGFEIVEALGSSGVLNLLAPEEEFGLLILQVFEFIAIQVGAEPPPFPELAGEALWDRCAVDDVLADLRGVRASEGKGIGAESALVEEGLIQIG